jgi:MFS family permease
VGLAGLVLMAAGILGSSLAWDYWALLVCRLITGVGAAMIPPNSMAAIADHFPPAQRGTPISTLISVSFFGVAIGTPAVAFLLELGGWRLPFYVVGALLVMVWAGEARATANGFLATSNPLGIIGGASVGGIVLALGEFPLVGLFCMGAAAVAAAIVTALKFRIARTPRVEARAA